MRLFLITCLAIFAGTGCSTLTICDEVITSNSGATLCVSNVR